MEKPRVLIWYWIYCGLQAALAGLAPIIYEKELFNSPHWEVILLRILIIVFFAIYAFAFVLPRRPWAWIYHLVIICIGLMSCCWIPIGVPILIFWIKPETKAYFGMSQ